MLPLPVPDYFQEDSEGALRSRVQWLETEIGLDTSFFARLLQMEEETFARWTEQRAILPQRKLLDLREVWEIMLHVLSFVNFDCDRARRFLEFVPSAAARERGARPVPPWAESSLKTHLETHGSDAVDDVNRWVTSFRFGAPFLTPEQEAPCPSATD